MAVLGGDNNQIGITVTTAANTDGLTKAESSLKQLEGASTSTGLSFGKLTESFATGTLIANGITAAVGFVKDQLSDVFAVADERQRGLAQLNNVIKSTGDVSGVTAKAATDLAEHIQATTPIDNDAAQAAENMLLTFTSIGKDQFAAATQAVTDMATAMNNGATPSAQQLSDTAIQVGKALQDPINGVTTLRRVGVQLTNHQQEQVKAMMAAGDQMGAQKIILGELSREFGGSAAAALDTNAGKWQQVKNAITDAKVEIGNVLEKALAPLLSGIAKFVSSETFTNWIKGTITGIQDVISFIGSLINFIGILTSSAGKQLGGWGTVIAELERTGKSVMTTLKQAFDFLKPSLDALWTTFEKNLYPALKRLWDLVSPYLIPTLKILGTIIGVEVVAGLWIAINVLNIIIKIFSDLIDISIAVAKGIIDAVQTIVGWLGYLKDHFFEVIGEILANFFLFPVKLPIYIADAIGKVIGIITSVNWGAVFSGIGNAIWGAGQSIMNAIGNAYHYITNLNWGAIVGGIGKGIGNAIIDLINGAIKGAFSGVPILKDHVPQIPHFATGVRNFTGGLALVGENGPELVSLPKGSDVHTNQESRQMINRHQNITVNQTISNQVDMQKALIDLGWQLRGIS